MSESEVEGLSEKVVGEVVKNSRRPKKLKHPKKQRQKREGRIRKWFRESRSELKKVTWPTFKQLRADTFSVFAYVFLVGTFIWFLDWIFLKIVSFLAKK